MKQLRKLDSTQYIMQNHASKQFSFLENSDNSASRMVYYSSLAKVLFAEDSGEREFYEFMKPFEATFDKLATLPSIEAFRQEPVKVCIVCLRSPVISFLVEITIITQHAYHPLFTSFV